MFYPHEMISRHNLPKLTPKPFPKKGAILLDVRTLPEYAEGHAEEAILMPLEDIDFFKGVIKDWRRPILTCSGTGVRSKKAVRRLRKEGIPAFDGGSWEKW